MGEMAQMMMIFHVRVLAYTEKGAIIRRKIHFRPYFHLISIICTHCTFVDEFRSRSPSHIDPSGTLIIIFDFSLLDYKLKSHTMHYYCRY